MHAYKEIAMSRLRKGIFVAMSVLSVAGSVNATEESNVVGLFAEPGYVGSKAGEKTMTEANAYCLGKSSDGSQAQESLDSDFYDSYQSCMKDFVPFRNAGVGSTGSCETQTVQWGQCSATVTAGASGAIRAVSNVFDTDMYEGTGEFRCSAGNWQMTGGGCKRNPVACESGLTVSWAVTTPAWADESISTTYKDRYGQVRHTPKSRCQAIMIEAESGYLTEATISPSLMFEPEQYSKDSVSNQRCFDGDWIGQPNAGTDSCSYIPKSCKAKDYSYNGCGYQLPAGEHDSVFIAKNPSPLNSVGSVEAYCWDGEWEVKSQSCQLSCGDNVNSYSWLGEDPRACSHDAYVISERITPGTALILDNEQAGMLGDAGYRCENGSWVKTSEVCKPKGCDTVYANNWGTNNACGHEQFTGIWEHGEEIAVDSDAVFDAQGSTGYICQYGGLIRGEDGAMDSNPNASETCQVINDERICVSAEAQEKGSTGSEFNPIDFDFDACERVGYYQSGQMCCAIDRANLERQCYQIP